MRVCERGCMGPDGEPREADHGYLCERCMNRLRAAIADAPDLAAHIRASMVPMPSQVYDREIVTGGGSSFGQPPMNVDAVDAVDSVLQVLRWWASYFGDEFPYNTMLPNVPSGASPGAVALLVQWPAGYLVANIGDVCNDIRVKALAHMVLDWPEEFGEWTLKKAASRWPRERKGFYSSEPCPECDLRGVWVSPPPYHGGEFRIACKGCHWMPLNQTERDRFTKGQK